MVYGSVVISFRCAFLRGIECVLLRGKFAEATRVKRFTTMRHIGMSRDVSATDYDVITASQIASNSS